MAKIRRIGGGGSPEKIPETPSSEILRVGTEQTRKAAETTPSGLLIKDWSTLQRELQEELNDPRFTPPIRKFEVTSDYVSRLEEEAEGYIRRAENLGFTDHLKILARKFNPLDLIDVAFGGTGRRLYGKQDYIRQLRLMAAGCYKRAKEVYLPSTDTHRLLKGAELAERCGDSVSSLYTHKFEEEVLQNYSKGGEPHEAIVAVYRALKTRALTVTARIGPLQDLNFIRLLGCQYENNGHSQEAVDKYLLAGDYDAASKVFEERGDLRTAARVLLMDPSVKAGKYAGMSRVVQAARMYDKAGDLQSAIDCMMSMCEHPKPSKKPHGSPSVHIKFPSIGFIDPGELPSGLQLIPSIGPEAEVVEVWRGYGAALVEEIPRVRASREFSSESDKVFAGLCERRVRELEQNGEIEKAREMKEMVEGIIEKEASMRVISAFQKKRAAEIPPQLIYLRDKKEYDSYRRRYGVNVPDFDGSPEAYERLSHWKSQVPSEDLERARELDALHEEDPYAWYIVTHYGGGPLSHKQEWEASRYAEGVRKAREEAERREYHTE